MNKREQATAAAGKALAKPLRKQVALIQIDGDFTLVERQTYNFLLLHCFDELTSTRTHMMPIALLKLLLGWDASENTTALKAALKTIMTTKVEFNLLDRRGGEKWEGMTLMSWADIENGMVSWRFDEAMVRRLAEPALYATIHLAVTQKMKSVFTLALYENCLRFCDQKNGKDMSTGVWTIKQCRRLVGAGAPVYDQFKYLNRDVLQPAIKEINHVSDIEIVLDTVREGRVVTGVRFDVRPTKQGRLWSGEGDDGAAAAIVEAHPELCRRMAELKVPRKLIPMFFHHHRAEEIEAAVGVAETALRAGKIRTNAAGYFKKTLENGPALTSSTFAAQESAKIFANNVEASMRATEAGIQGGVERERQLQAREQIAKLTRLELESLANEYAQEKADGGVTVTFNALTGKFGDKKVALFFNAWLVSRMMAESAANN